ncbi:hypothetical protein ckin37_08160 [Helicobacter pylori]
MSVKTQALQRKIYTNFFTSKGKESANTKALKDFANAIGNTQISTANDLGAGLRGRALLEYICIQKRQFRSG